ASPNHLAGLSKLCCNGIQFVWRGFSWMDQGRGSVSLNSSAGIRAAIRDLSTENVAELAVRASSLTAVIPLWYGEGGLVTPQFVRDAAKAALDGGMTFYIPDMRGLPALTEALSQHQSRIHGREIPVSRSTVTPSGMQ